MADLDGPDEMEAYDPVKVPLVSLNHRSQQVTANSKEKMTLQQLQQKSKLKQSPPIRRRVGGSNNSDRVATLQEEDEMLHTTAL